MIPDYMLLADDADFTSKIRDRFIRLTIEDNAGIESDSLKLELADNDWKLNIPVSGAKLKAYLGYKGTPLMLMGQYVVDTPEYCYTPNKIIISAKAADVYRESREKILKTRSFHKRTLGYIVDIVARDMGLQAAISAELSGIFIEHVDQTDESNLHFLTRLAQRYDATAKPAGGKLVFVKKGAGASASGLPLPVETIALSDIQPGARWKKDGRGEHDGVEAEWHDKKLAKKQTETIGGSNRKKLRGTYATKDDAIKAIQAEYQRLQRDPTTFNFALKRGNPLYRAEMQIITDSSFRKKEVAGKQWLAQKVIHTLTRKPGYTTTVNTTGTL